MSETRSIAPKERAYTRIVVEFVIAVIALSIIGAILSIFPGALGITKFYELISKLILLGLGVVMILAIIHVPLKRRMQIRGGAHFGSSVSFFATVVLIIFAFLTLLSVLSISFSTLLVAVGGISIVVGFAISTVTTNIISGAFMLTSYPIRVGQRIIITVNNQPGTITDVGTLFMTVTTDAGAKLIIPNSAVFQGMAFLLDINPKQSSSKLDGGPLLLAKSGDRVISSLYPYPATVTEVTSMVTKLVTDTGQLLVIPNQAILNGNSTLVRIEQPQEAGSFNLPIALGDEVRLSGGTFTGKVTEIGPYYFRVSGSEEDVLLPTAGLTNGGIIVFKKKTKTT
jgi:small-conductance mechanosensitive channel